MAYLAPPTKRPGSLVRQSPPIHYGDQIRLWVVSVSGKLLKDEYGGYLSLNRDSSSGARYNVSPTNQLHATFDEPCTFTVRHPTHPDTHAPVTYGALVHLSLDAEPDSIWAPLPSTGLIGPRPNGSSAVEVLFRFHAAAPVPDDGSEADSHVPTANKLTGVVGESPEAPVLTNDDLIDTPVYLGAHNVVLEAVPLPAGDAAAVAAAASGAPMPAKALSSDATAASLDAEHLALLPLHRRLLRAYQPVTASTLGAGLSFDGRGDLLGFGVALPAARVASVTLVQGLAAVDTNLYPSPGNVKTTAPNARAPGSCPEFYGSAAGEAPGERRLRRVGVECWDRDFALARGTALPPSTALVITIPGAGTARIPAAYLPPPPMNLPLLISGANEEGFPQFFEKAFPLEAPPNTAVTVEPTVEGGEPETSRIVGSITVRWTRVPVAPVQTDFAKRRARRGDPAAEAAAAAAAAGKAGAAAGTAAEGGAMTSGASAASWLAYIILCAAFGAWAASVWDLPHTRALMRKLAEVPLVAGPLPDPVAATRVVAAYFSHQEDIVELAATFSSASVPALLVVLVALLAQRAAAGFRVPPRARTPAPIFLLRISAPVGRDGQPLFEPIDPVPGLISAAEQAEARGRVSRLEGHSVDDSDDPPVVISLDGPPEIVEEAGAPADGNEATAAALHSSGSAPTLTRRLSSVMGTSLAPPMEVPTAAEYARLDEPRLMVAQILHGIRLSTDRAAQAAAAGRFEDGGPADVKHTVPALHPQLCDEVEVKDYAPASFLRIRQAHGISQEVYSSSWTFSAATMPALALGAGRSGSLFLNSADGRFLFKTITKDDMATLRVILSSYTEHVCTKASRLMRFVGLYRFRFSKTGETRHIVVAANIFHVPRPLAEQGLDISAKFDLKGRKPKKAPEMRPLEPNRGVFKDNQVSRVFEASEAVRDALVRTMKEDVVFLRSHDLIDYSLLVGLVEPAQGEPGAPLPEGALATIKQVTLHTTEADFMTVGSTPVVPAPEGLPELYSVGIIDFLSRYQTWKKKTAHFFKSFLWNDEELSTVNSAFYAKRFDAYLDVIFPPSDAAVVSAEDTEALVEYGIDPAEVRGGPHGAAGALIYGPSGRPVVVLPDGVKSSPAMPRFNRADNSSPLPSSNSESAGAGALATTPADAATAEAIAGAPAGALPPTSNSGGF